MSISERIPTDEPVAHAARPVPDPFVDSAPGAALAALEERAATPRFVQWIYLPNGRLAATNSRSFASGQVLTTSSAVSQPRCAVPMP
jgi:hypothetical protein